MFVYVSEKMSMLMKQLKKVSQLDHHVLIVGETGTGKEYVSRYVHKNSARKKSHPVMFNCGALSESIKESELFGHTKGAFTGAHSERAGVFEQAHNTTLILDEIGELPMHLQPVFLRTIEYKEFTKLGSAQSQRSNFRIVASTNKDLKTLSARGKFRSDLYYRLSMIQFDIPPLRERRDDIIPICLHLYDTISVECKLSNPPPLRLDLLQYIKNLDLPGNVRQIRNILLRYMIQQIDPRDEANDIVDACTTVLAATHSKMDCEKVKLIRHYLNKNNWNKQATAHDVGVAKSTLYKMIKKYDIRRA